MERTANAECTADEGLTPVAFAAENIWNNSHVISYLALNVTTDLASMTKLGLPCSRNSFNINTWAPSILASARTGPCACFSLVVASHDTLTAEWFFQTSLLAACRADQGGQQC
jgi:hypothetical protein